MWIRFVDSFLKDSFCGFVSCKQKSQITRFVLIRKDSYTNPASLIFLLRQQSYSNSKLTKENANLQAQWNTIELKSIFLCRLPILISASHLTACSRNATERWTTSWRWGRRPSTTDSWTSGSSSRDLRQEEEVTVWNILIILIRGKENEFKVLKCIGKHFKSMTF